MKNFKLTPLMLFLIILIVLVISVYLKNSYFVEGIENMFNDKGQFSDFILPEYSQTAPLTQLTETIFYDKMNGNIVEAVVDWITTETTADSSIPEDDVANGDDADVPATDAPATDAPATDAPVTDAPATDAPVTDAPATDAPATDAPVNGVDVPANGSATDTDTDADVMSDSIPESMASMYEGHENMKSVTPLLMRLIITPRGGAESYIYDITPTKECSKKPTQESLIDKIDATYSSWSYVSQSEYAPETTVFYMPWKNDTYLAIFEKSDSKMIPRGVFNFSSGKNGVVDVKEVEITNYVNTQDDNNNKYVKDEKYGKHDLYQMDKFVLYDIPTSNLIVRKEHNTGSISIYNGLGEIITSEKVKETYEANKTHENQEKYSDLKAWSALDGQGENIVIYIKNADKTVVAVCGFESSTMESLVLKNVKRFTLYGMDNGDKIEKPTPSACDKKEKEEPTKEEGDKKSTVDEAKSDDYILKTQIVPPVCPSCPMCPGKVSCTNCGGTGGSGTMGSDGKSMVKDEKTITKVVDSNGNVISETVGEVTDLARDTASGAVGLAKDTVGGTVGLAKETVGGAVGLAKETVGGAIGLASGIVGGVTGLVRDTGRGAVNLLTPEQQQRQQLNGGRAASQQTGGQPGQSYGTNNNYSYYGALPNRQSNFIPRTADFSSFA